MPTALALSDVAKRFRAGVVGCFASVDALRGVSLAVPQGEHVGLFGPAGSGKTTLLLCAAGIMRPDAGRIAWFGEASATREGGWAPPGVSYVPERVSCYAFLTVREALHHYDTLQERSGADRRARVDAAIDRLALGPLADTRLARLGRGALARLAFAQALVDEPRLLLLDGTLDALDPASRPVVRALAAELRSAGVTMVLATRDVATLDGLVERASLLAEGELRATFRCARGAPRRALHLTVSRPRRAAALLRTRVSGVEHDAERVRVSLDGASPEEVLAHCAALDIAVHTSRVVADDLHERLSELVARHGRVAEGRE
ncbi:MAG: ATP-binding cassette domain-containing protein [Gemmatimonadaceae bacterium]